MSGWDICLFPLQASCHIIPKQDDTRHYLKFDTCLVPGKHQRRISNLKTTRAAALSLTVSLPGNSIEDKLTTMTHVLADQGLDGLMKKMDSLDVMKHIVLPY